MSQSTLKNNFLRVEAMSRDWMTKRGKASLVYFDREQVKTLYDYY